MHVVQEMDLPLRKIISQVLHLSLEQLLQIHSKDSSTEKNIKLVFCYFGAFQMMPFMAFITSDTFFSFAIDSNATLWTDTGHEMSLGAGSDRGR